ncbi:MAG: SDR family oxidoreductase [Candidatus Puniceispirillaceae bacterium]
MREFARTSIPAQRPASLEEIGKACLFPCSADSRYINGQNLLIDGGMNRGVRQAAGLIRPWPPRNSHTGQCSGAGPPCARHQACCPFPP